jgi:hypothetical protein
MVPIAFEKSVIGFEKALHSSCQLNRPILPTTGPQMG